MVVLRCCWCAGGSATGCAVGVVIAVIGAVLVVDVVVENKSLFIEWFVWDEVLSGKLGIHQHLLVPLHLHLQVLVLLFEVSKIFHGKLHCSLIHAMFLLFSQDIPSPLSIEYEEKI